MSVATWIREEPEQVLVRLPESLATFDAKATDRKLRKHGLRLRDVGWGPAMPPQPGRDLRVEDGVPWRTDRVSLVRVPNAGEKMPPRRYATEIKYPTISAGPIEACVGRATAARGPLHGVSTLGPVEIRDSSRLPDGEASAVVAFPSLARGLYLDALRLRRLIRWTAADSMRAFAPDADRPRWRRGVVLLREGEVVGALMGMLECDVRVDVETGERFYEWAARS